MSKAREKRMERQKLRDWSVCLADFSDARKPAVIRSHQAHPLQRLTARANPRKRRRSYHQLWNVRKFFFSPIINVSDPGPGPNCIRIQSGQVGPDPGGQRWPTKIEKSEEISCFKVLYVLFWGLMASPGLDVFVQGIGTVLNCNFFIKKYIKNFQPYIL